MQLRIAAPKSILLTWLVPQTLRSCRGKLMALQVASSKVTKCSLPCSADCEDRRVELPPPPGPLMLPADGAMRIGNAKRRARAVVGPNRRGLVPMSSGSPARPVR